MTLKISAFNRVFIKTMRHKHTISETAAKFLNLIEGGYWKLDDEAVNWASGEGRDAVADYGAGLLTSEGHDEFSSGEAGRATLQAAENAGVRTLVQLKDFINWEDDGSDDLNHDFKVGDRVKVLSGPTRGMVGTISSFSTHEGGEAAWVELDGTRGRWLFVDELASA